jgi:hypothetical protein
MMNIVFQIDWINMMDSMDHQLLIKFAKYLESCKDHKYDNSITLALNIYPSRSIEYNPGLSVRFC